MSSEENQNTEDKTTEENFLSAEPKEEISEGVPVVENLEVEKPAEQTEISEPEIVEEVVEEKVVENSGLPHSSATAPEFAKTTTEEILQI